MSKKSCEVEKFEEFEEFEMDFELNDKFNCTLDDIVEEENKIDLTKFISKEFYDYEYFKKRFDKFDDSILELLVELSKEKVIVHKKPQKKKNEGMDVKIIQKDTLITFDF